MFPRKLADVLESSPRTNHAVSKALISTSLRTTGLSFLSATSLFAVCSMGIMSVSLPQSFTISIVAQFGFRDAEVFRRLRSQHQVRFLRRKHLVLWCHTVQTSLLSSSFHRYMQGVLYAHRTIYATKIKTLRKHTRHSSNGSLLRRDGTTPASQCGGFAPVEV